MNDEAAVTELIDRDGWPEAPSTAGSRFRVGVAMVAVVLGCGLAALLVHIGSEQQRADSPNSTTFDLPHGPSGGLAGGGVPASPERTTEITGTSTRITVTNEPPPTLVNGLPWATPQHPTSTVTVTQPPTRGSTSTTTSTAPPSSTGGGTGGRGDDSSAATSPNAPSSHAQNPRPSKDCNVPLLGICLLG